MIRSLALVIITAVPVFAVAQETATPVVQSPPVVSHAVVAREVMGRTIALDLTGVTLRAALKALSAQAHVELVYDWQTIPVDKTVTLVTDHITVREALAVLLDGTNVEPVVTDAGRIRLQPHGDVLLAVFGHQQGTATVTGLVTDSGTGAIITQAVVHVDGTQLTTRTNATGHYTFSGLAPGEYRVTARHVGFLAKTRVVTLTDSGAKTIDFLLNEPATTLNEVVTTALGDQRRYQVGNVIATINVDSIAPNAPVTSVTDLITGRAPGVEVVESSGEVGSGQDIRIRGVSSLLLQSDPIIIVDGIRVDNTAGDAAFGNSAVGFGTPYRLNDLDFNQIQTIDILKGPAATTEYGTDGANGVIVITTKRGVSGHPQWTASATEMASTVPTNYPPVVWSWGHSTDGKASPWTNPNGTGNACLVTTGNGDHGLMSGSVVVFPSQESGMCVADSVTSFNPLNNAATTPYGTGPTNRYDLSVGGGSDAWRYYFGGGLSNATGVYKLPDVYLGDAQALGFPNSALRPNTQQQTSLAANTMLKASSSVDVSAGVHIVQTYANFPNAGGLSFGETAALDDSVHNYGYGNQNNGATYNELEQASPLSQVLGSSSSQNTAQWIGNATLDWRPASWVTGNMTAGIDHETQEFVKMLYPQADLLQSNFTDTAGGGELTQQQTVQDLYTVTMRATATATLWRSVRVMTTVGGNYVDQRYGAVEAIAHNLPASNFTIASASSALGFASQAADKSGGAYIEESLAFGDRCYAPLGLRFDVASGYGANVTGTQNPNLSLTCTILTGRTSLRLRGAYGISDVQPPFGANLLTYSAVTEQAPGVSSGSSTVYLVSNPGNVNLKPERDQELEGGFDLGLWDGRLGVEFTAYNKRAHDLLWSQALGWEAVGSYEENVGDARNEGLEGTVSANLVQTRPVSLGVTVNGSVNHNKLLTLAPDLLTTRVAFSQYFAAGYPLYGFWGLPPSYADRNGSGELESSEINFNSQAQPGYAGSSSPVEMVSVAPSVGVWRNTVVINALLEYEGDYKVEQQPCVYNSLSMFCMPGESGLGEPLWQQSLALEMSYGNPYSHEFSNGTYMSWRELSMAVNVPKGWARRVRLQNLSLVGAVRNLALWTRYLYGDPETAAITNVGSGLNAASGSTTYNNDIRVQVLGTVPLTRQWTVRVNAAF